MVKGPHQSADPEEIVKELKDRGFKAINASNVKTVEWIEIQKPQPQPGQEAESQQQVYQKQFK